jgi:hypothetical protein
MMKLVLARSGAEQRPAYCPSWLYRLPATVAIETATGDDSVLSANRWLACTIALGNAGNCDPTLGCAPNR